MMVVDIVYLKLVRSGPLLKPVYLARALPAVYSAVAVAAEGSSPFGVLKLL